MSHFSIGTMNTNNLECNAPYIAYKTMQNLFIHGFQVMTVEIYLFIFTLKVFIPGIIIMHFEKNVLILVMHESQSHGTVKVGKAMVVSIDEVKGQGPLDWTASSARSSTYETGPINMLIFASLMTLRSD